LLGGAGGDAAAHWADFGLALGLGFQIQDDLLGIWGTSEATGKPAADDIRRRKKSLPILLLNERLDSGARAELDRLYTTERIDNAGVAGVLALLDQTGIRVDVEREIAQHHDQAVRALREAAPRDDNPYRERLLALVERLATRTA
jgi:geranylgeranyl diphosphate synthase type I